MWELVLALLAVLGAFTLCIRLCLSTFQKLLASAQEATTSGIREISVIQSEALAKVLAPVFTPSPVPAQAQDLPVEAIPEWRQEADSIDLIDETGRPTSWETPVIPESESVGPNDLWANPSQT